jgi:dihydropteroate synthase
MHKSKVEDTYFQGKSSIRLGDISLDLTRPVVMGILNVTPDSFYADSRRLFGDDLLVKAENMITEGATILDLGGYSSRPGAKDISIQEEMDRVLPAVELLFSKIENPTISVDTFRPQVAEEALKGGAQIINDISGYQIDSDMFGVLKKHKPAYICMHMRGTPQTMKDLTHYPNGVTAEVVRYFTEKLSDLEKAGVTQVILDPGFGFSKTTEQSHELLSEMQQLLHLNKPILAGVSRKSMIYKRLEIKPEDALNGTSALNAIALSKGAKILRVHDVKPAAEIIRLLFGSDKQI